MLGIGAAVLLAGINLGVGVVVPEHEAAVPWYTAGLRFPLSGGIYLEPELGYFHRTPNWPENNLSDVLSVGANVVFPLGSGRLRPFLGAGVGVHLIRYEPKIYCDNCDNGKPIILGTDPFINTVPRLHAMLGVDYSLSSRTTLFTALRLDLPFLPGDDDLTSQAKLYAGVRWRP